MNVFTPGSVAIISSTYFPSWYQGPLRSIHHTDKIRGDLALEFFEKVIDLGYHVVVADGFSSKVFQKKLWHLQPQIIIVNRTKKASRSVARNEALFRAAKIKDVRAVLYTEAEKLSLIPSIPKILLPILRNEADVIIPTRNERLFKQTYPAYQYESEKEANILYNELLHVHGLLPQTDAIDMFFGPRAYVCNDTMLRLFRKKVSVTIASQVLHSKYYRPEDYSDALFFPILLAKRQGLRIRDIEIPFAYPLLQRQNEELGKKKLFEEKRKTQRLSILIELMHFLQFLNKQK